MVTSASYWDDTQTYVTAKQFVSAEERPPCDLQDEDLLLFRQVLHAQSVGEFHYQMRVPLVSRGSVGVSEIVGSNQAFGTKSYCAAGSSEYPAIIRIEKGPKAEYVSVT
jgi:hypothetical protein